MLVKAQVSEADVIHLRPGQKAWFTVLGDPLTRYEGKLKDILPTPEKVNDAIFYDARFEGPTPQGILRLDMTAQVHMQLAEVKNVITIPLGALGDAVGDNRYHVRLLRTGEVKEREVIIGARNDTDVAVVQGLEEGDEVIVGESARALSRACRLREAGCGATAIRPPTVPVGSARLRLTLTAAHQAEDINRLLEALHGHGE